MITSAITILDKSRKKDVLRFYKSQGVSVKYKGFDHVYGVIDKNNDIVACTFASKLSESNTLWLLHGLVVSPQYRNKGLASALVSHTVNLHHPIVCFADSSLTNFYEKNQFALLSADESEQRLTEPLNIRYKSYLKNQPNLKVFALL